MSKLLNVDSHHQDGALYSHDLPLQKLKKKSFGRTYYILAAVTPRKNENQRDMRVPSPLGHFLGEKRLLSITSLV